MGFQIFRAYRMVLRLYLLVQLVFQQMVLRVQDILFQSSTRKRDDDPAGRWYISVINHKKRRGGIEFAGGLFVNPLMPEAAAAKLRAVKTKPDP